MKKVVFLLMVFISVLFISGCEVKKTEEVTDAEKFASEYSVDSDNPFKYTSISKVLDIFENGTGIIFFADSDCDWCVATAKVFTDALNYKNVEKVYYYNPKSIRDKNTKNYKKLIKIIEEYVEKNEDDEPYLYLPDIYFVKNGKIIGHNNDTATMGGTVDEALSKKTKKELKDKYLELISEYNAKECSSAC
ncbi:MAG: hypothetical protein E7160_04820 [Firmicutes bacterium]|nr:hypothetical protein [Bacillota bacterium]